MNHAWELALVRSLIGRGRAPFADANHPLLIGRRHVLRVRTLQDVRHRPNPCTGTDIARHPGMDETDVRSGARTERARHERITRKHLSTSKRSANGDGTDPSSEPGRCKGGHGVSCSGIVVGPGDGIANINDYLDWREPRLEFAYVHRMVHRPRG